jgi:hypothetical protein
MNVGRGVLNGFERFKINKIQTVQCNMYRCVGIPNYYRKGHSRNLGTAYFAARCMHGDIFSNLKATVIIDELYRSKNQF